jgi:hypothetical protein
MNGDWIWISLAALWQRWWPERVCLELLDDKMQAGYVQDAENDTRTAVVTWLDAWSDVLRLGDATGISSIEEFDDRFPMTQSLFNWSQDLEMALENAGRDDGEIRQALTDFCEESFRRFPREDQLLTENRRRTMAQAYFDAGMTEKSEELFRSWLDANSVPLAFSNQRSIWIRPGLASINWFNARRASVRGSVCNGPRTPGW